MKPDMSDTNGVRIDVQNITFSYGDSREPVLKDVSLQIRANEITVLFGPGMAGKSTLLRLLNRLTDLLEGNELQGRILLDGEDVYAPGVNVTDLRRRVGMVFAVPIPLPDTIWGNVAYGPKLTGVRDKNLLDEIKNMRQEGKTTELFSQILKKLEEV